VSHRAEGQEIAGTVKAGNPEDFFPLGSCALTAALSKRIRNLRPKLPPGSLVVPFGNRFDAGAGQ